MEEASLPMTVLSAGTGAKTRFKPRGGLEVIDDSNNENNNSPAPETPSGQGTDAPQHTESPPAAQGTPAVLEAQNRFLARLNDRVRNLEILGLVSLNLPLAKLPAATAYGARWAAESRRAYRIVARINKRRRLMANP